MFPNVTMDKIMELAQTVGRRTAGEYPGVDAEEIASEAVACLADKSRRMDDPTAGYVYRVLERDARAYAAKVRYEQVIETSQYVYTPSEISALLGEVYFDPACWDVPTAKDDRLSAEINGRSVGISLMDIKVGLERIKPEHRKVIEDRFGRGDESIHRQKVARAVESLVRSVNRIAAKAGKADNCPGARTAMSNDRARYVTQAESGHETNPRERDALARLSGVRRERTDPPGTHFNWSKYAV